VTGKEIEMLQSLFNFLSSIAFLVSSAFGINMSTEQQPYEVIEQIGKKKLKSANTRHGLLLRQL
jgi:hypothetical protein